MTDKPQFKVYDKVWVIQNNKPTQLIVFAVVESMDYWKTSTEFYYHLVSSKIGAGWGNNEGYRFPPQDVYATKEQAIAGLLLSL